MQRVTKQLTRVAVGQMTSGGDKAANFEVCKRLAEEASNAGCSMLFLPECFSFIGRGSAESLAAAENVDDPSGTMAWYRQLARDTDLWLSLGGFQETGPDADHVCNTHVVLNSEGDTAASYRKMHLYDVDVPGGPTMLESGFTHPGEPSDLVVCPSPAGALGVTVCYDMRFPELYTCLRSRGAEILTMPSAFMVKTGMAHWDVLLRARAIENQCYVIAAAQSGRHHEKRESYGHAMIVDPWGDVVAKCAQREGACIATADIDLAYMRDLRARMPVMQQRKLPIDWAKI